MVKQITWVMGNSAAGKRTFIERVQDDFELQQRFEFEGRIGVSQISTEMVPRNKWDTIGRYRRLIPNELLNLADVFDTILLKWQYTDTNEGRLTQIQEMMSEVRHRAIFLEASPEVHLERLRQKPFWALRGEVSDEITLAKEEEGRAVILGTIPDMFEFVRVSSDPDVNYPIIAS